MTTPEAPDGAVLLAQLINGPPWHAHAACSGADPALSSPSAATADLPGALDIAPRRCREVVRSLAARRSPLVVASR